MTIFLLNIKRIVRKKFRVLAMLILPIIITAVIMHQGFDPSTVRVAIVDNDKTDVTKALIYNIKASSKLIVVDEKDIEKYIAFGRINYALIIGQGFTSKVINGMKPNITCYYDNKSNIHLILDYDINSFLSLVNNIALKSNRDTNTFYSNFSKLEINKININYNINGSKEKATIRTALSFLVMFMLIFSIDFSAQILNIKQKNTITRTFAAPVSIASYIFQSILNLFLLITIQVTILFLIFAIIFNKTITPYLLSLYLLFIAFSITSVALGVFISSIGKDIMQTAMFSNLIVVPISILGGCFWSHEIMPDTIKLISYFTPVTWVINAMEKIMLYDYKLKALSPDFLVIILFAIVFFLLGIVTKEDIIN